MKIQYLFILSLLFLPIENLNAQKSLPVRTNIQKAIDNGTRTTNGVPGKNYWQNHSVYQITVRFDPTTRQVSGQEEITFSNNSPDTLHRILLKLFPNVYKKGSPRRKTFNPEDLTDGVFIENMEIEGQKIPDENIHINATNMWVSIDALKPQKNIKLNIHWNYELNNKASHDRTGEVDNGAYFIAYFFPRIAVYDDIDGWDTHNYNGTQEFYNDFDDFDVQIKVPQDYVVWATGTLQNHKEVLSEKYIKRIQQAEKDNNVIDIITKSDLQEGKITKANKINTWHFNVENITDFVFAISNHYVWKSTSLEIDSTSQRRTRIDAVYNPDHKEYKEVVNFGRQTVKEMSQNFPRWPFPYPHISIFDGLDAMEYPMMVNDYNIINRAENISTTVHEVFHTMFPFFMGINETKYSFMDEGWATLAEWLIGTKIDSNATALGGIKEYNRLAGNEEDLPIMTKSTNLSGGASIEGVDITDMAYFLNSYPKPGLGYLYIKDLLGDQLFTRALHHYIKQWYGKHPIPWDFFNSINEGSGKNLNWFWKSWFFDYGYPDLAIQDVTPKEKGYTVKIKTIGNKPVPVNLTFHFEDGSTQKEHRSIEVWKNNDAVVIPLNSSKKLYKVELGGIHDADIDKTDNVFVVE